MDQRLTLHRKYNITLRSDTYWQTATGWRAFSILNFRGLATWPAGIIMAGIIIMNGLR
jgi:hypothetical protein